jgi:hypothetical protein
MSLPRCGPARKDAERPPPCGVCGAAAWWNGWREVTRRRLGTSVRVEIHPGQRLHRAKCSRRGCPAPSWTVYPPGRYPDRRFDLDVVAQAVAESAFERDEDGRATAYAAIGRRYSCSGRSVSRWTNWVARLTDIESLARECIRIDPEGMPAAVRPQASGTSSRARAGWALAVFDRFAELLERSGVLPRGQQPSLVRILDDQRLRHGAHLPLRALSPPLSIGAADAAPHGG